ncbi:hypothetical protein L5F68_08285 [Aliarcobacter butzleri]|uniref:DUF5677 domain-containing protein n=1 Tax=Aliarcobacter butzleri TaxID=28197 RepID=UPI001EE00D96|nr:DUF5677 domain-containing protein [Aliarcobacter butzleri]MCG3704330.1 hypothetical protein [Aliarcobacter butzleri]
MIELTESEYREYTKDIENEEVEEILFSILEKINIKLCFIENYINDDEELEILKINFFKIFFKQFNTIIILLSKTKYKYNLKFEYTDIKSIYILIRSVHELYLTFQYIFNSKYFNVSKEEETNFKYLLYKYCGEKDNIKAFHNKKNITGLNDEQEQALVKYEKASEKMFSLISSNKIYHTLSKTIKKKIQNGISWKINKEKELTWTELLENTYMSTEYGKGYYAVLCQYSHTTYNSITLELNHNYDKLGVLYHLSLITSLIVKEYINISFDGNIVKITEDDIISKRELSLIVEFITMSISGYFKK